MKNNKITTVEQAVESLMDENITSKPYDYLFGDTADTYPKINHELLELPGFYSRKESSRLYTQKNRTLEADSISSVCPDGKKIFREATIDLEQETGPVKEDKKEIIFEYALQASFKYKKPCYPYIVTNHEYEEEFFDYCKEDIIIRMHLIVFDKKRVYKNINTLNEKDFTKDEFTPYDLVRFKHCLVFAKMPYAIDVLEKLVELFTKIKIINAEIQSDLFSSLNLMIQYHFRHDTKKIKELLTMITEQIPKNQLNDVTKQAELKNKLVASENSNKEKDLIINEQGQALNQKNQELNQKDQELNQKDQELNQKDHEIEKLKSILQKNNITVMG